MRIMCMAFIDRVIIVHGKTLTDFRSSHSTGHRESQMDLTGVITASNITCEMIKTIVSGE